MHEGTKLNEGTKMHKEYFAQRVKIARRSILHGGSNLYGDNFARNTTHLKYLSNNFKECLLIIKKIIFKIDKCNFLLILNIFKHLFFF